MNVNAIRVARLGIGLAQGLFLYLLYYCSEHKLWLATETKILVPLILVGFVTPVILILNIGIMKPRRLIAWALAASAVLFGLGVYDVTRRAPQDGTYRLFNQLAGWPSIELSFFVVAGFFIAQALIASGDADNKRIASYPRYFDVAWKTAVQLKFSFLFCLTFWLIMVAGEALFSLIKVTALEDLLKHEWFDVPLTAIVFAYGLHLTDVRAAIVRGIRTLILTLQSWLLPVIVLFVAVFLLVLPVKGMEPMWKTHHASQILLGATAWLILLINCAYQDGTAENRPARVLQYAARLGAVLLVPLVILAVYALFLRVGEYGWTVNIIHVALCLIVAGCYAVGYLFAAVDHTAWLRRIETTNIYASFAILFVLVAIFSPIADPARLSVADQIARLNSGKVPADKFDYTYLKRDGAMYGYLALEKLREDASGTDPRNTQIHDGADAALKSNGYNFNAPVKTATTLEEKKANLTIYPKGQTLPDNFLNKDWQAISKLGMSSVIPPCLYQQNMTCDVVLVAARGDEPAKILVSPMGGTIFLFEASGDEWVPSGNFNEHIYCKGVREAFRAGDFTFENVATLNMVIHGISIPVAGAQGCPDDIRLQQQSHPR